MIYLFAFGNTRPCDSVESIDFNLRATDIHLIPLLRTSLQASS
jgi:hypothetical protein